MGVYIRGMKMPSCCEECPLMHEGYLYGKFFPCVCNATDGKMLIKPSEVDMRDGLCPLVEIPEPHGRLIDADAYCEDLLREAHKVWGLLKPETIERINRTVDDLKNYPTIIEAEGSENHDD